MNTRKHKTYETLSNIIKNIMFVGVATVSTSIIFDINIENKYAFIFFTSMLGINLYFLQEIQINSSLTHINKDMLKIIEGLITLERTVKELQVLCTDEDILKRCENEVSNELDMIKNELNLNK